MAEFNHNNLSVLMTTDTVGGVWTYCMELCKAMQNHHVQFHLATLGAPMQQWQIDEVNSLQNVHVHVSTYKLEWMCDPWEDVDAASKWLLHLEKEVQPNIIHLNSYCYAALPFKAPKIVVAHSDVYSWWQAVKQTEVPDDWNEFYRRVKAGLDKSDIIIAPSQAMMQTILENYLTLNRKKIIYNSRDISAVYTERKHPVVLSVGRVWDEAKNIQLLTKAATDIKWKIKIAGDKQFQNSQTELSSNVYYLGKLSSAVVINELATASIYVLPAKYEPFGLSVLEAAMCGCALVLGDIPSLKEIWSDAALYVNTNDANELAATINRLIDDADLREYYQQKAKQRAERYNISSFAKQYYNTYTALLPKTHSHKQKEEVAL